MALRARLFVIGYLLLGDLGIVDWRLENLGIEGFRNLGIGNSEDGMRKAEVGRSR